MPRKTPRIRALQRFFHIGGGGVLELITNAPQRILALTGEPLDPPHEIANEPQKPSHETREVSTRSIVSTLTIFFKVTLGKPLYHFISTTIIP